MPIRTQLQRTGIESNIHIGMPTQLSQKQIPAPFGFAQGRLLRCGMEIQLQNLYSNVSSGLNRAEDAVGDGGGLHSRAYVVYAEDMRSGKNRRCIGCCCNVQAILWGEDFA